jgi:hypothetical protein
VWKKARQKWHGQQGVGSRRETQARVVISSPKIQATSVMDNVETDIPCIYIVSSRWQLESWARVFLVCRYIYIRTQSPCRTEGVIGSYILRC